MRSIIITLMIFSISCATLQIDTNNTFKLLTESGDSISCTVGLKNLDGVILDSKCLGYYEKDGSTYECSLEIGSDGRPITEIVNIKESCEIVIKK